MTTIRIDNISLPIQGGQGAVSTGFGIAIGNQIGLTAGHVANYQVITGGDGRTGHLIAPGKVKVISDRSEMSYPSGQTYYNEVIRAADEAVRYYNNWWSAYSEWKAAFVTWQTDSENISPPELSTYLTSRNVGSSPYPAYSLCGPVGTKSPNYSAQNIRSVDPDTIYNLLPQPTTKSILGEMSLKSRDAVLYKPQNSAYSSSSPGLAFFYNKGDLQALGSALGSSAYISFNNGASVTGGVTSTSVLGDTTGRLFVFRPNDLGKNAVNGTSGSPFLVSVGGSDYVFGTVSSSSILKSSLQNVCTTGATSNYDVKADPNGVTTGVYIDKGSFDEFNDAINSTTPPSLKGPTNLIVGVDRASASTGTGGFGTADGTLRRDLFIGTYGKELFKASGGDTVRVGAEDNIVDFDPNRDPNLRGDMTVQFGKTASGAASGNTVVEVDVSADNDYVLDLSSDANITPDNIDLIAGGQSLYWYPGASGTAQPGPDDGGSGAEANQRWLDNAHVEFLAVRLSAADGGSTITFVDKKTKVGIATTVHDGITGAINASPITKIKFANGVTWDAQKIFNYIVQKEKTSGGDGIAFVDAYGAAAGSQVGTFSEFFGPNPLNASGQSSISLTQPTQSVVSSPVVTAFSDAESDIIVAGQSGVPGGSGGQASVTGNPYALYGTAPGQTLDAGGTYSMVYGEGGGDTFVFNQGYGQVLIEEADAAATPDNVLRVGSGISASTTAVSADDSGDVILDFGNGDSVVLAGELLSANGTTYGVQQVQFADGTTWTYADVLARLQTASANSPILYGTAGTDIMDGKGLSKTLEGFGGGDTFVFKKGYGALAIEEKDTANSPSNVLKLGAGLTAANATVIADSSGMITIDFGGGDQVWLVGQLNSGGGIAYGVQQIRFADGTIWSQADLVSRLDVVNPNSTTLYGDNAGHIFDTQGIDNAIISHGGGDTIVYEQGYGALTLSETDLGANPSNVLELGAGITTAGTAVTADENGNLILSFGNGDSVTLTSALNSSGATTYGIQTIDFADGSVWHYADLLLAAATPSASNTMLYGDSGANVLDGRGIATTLVGAGGGDTFVYDQGYGALTIAEADAANTPNNILQVGPGLSASSLTVTGNDSGDMILSFGGSDTITLAGALASGNGVTYGVQQVTFANGTTLSYAALLTLAETPSASHTTLYGDSSANVLDGQGVAHTLVGSGGGDTIIFNQGYGQLTINEADSSSTPDNILRLGSGLGAGNLSVVADASGNLILDFGGGDRITLVNALNSSSSTAYGVQQVKFLDGSSLTYAQLLALADTPSASNATLYGDTGANTLDGQGIAHTLVGNGGGDTFVFNQGYDALIIAENDPNAADTNILQLGAGLNAASTSVSADAYGNLILDFGGGDVVTIQEALNAGTNTSNGIQQISFADGTTWTYAQMRAFADTGSATNTVLYGDGQGDTFDSKGSARSINSTGGGDTIIYNQSYGALTINEADTSGYADNTLVLGVGLSASDVTVSADANGNILLSFGGGDAVTLTGAMQRSDTTAYGVQNIRFADGTVWSIGDLRYQINPTAAGMAIISSNFAKTVNSDILDGGGRLNGNFGFTDSNTDDAHSVSVVGVSASGDVDPSLTNAQLLGFLKAAVGSDASGSDAGSIHWSFSGAGAFDYLQPGQNATFDYTIAVSDGEGGELRQDVTVTVTSSQSGGSQLTLYDRDVTINYESGRGDLYVNDVAGVVGPNNTLAFGAGIDPSMVTVTALTDPQATGDSLLDSLQLVVAGSGTITLADALSDPTVGVQTLTFADGTVWTYAQIVAMLGLQHPQGYPYSGKAVAVGGIGADVLDPQAVAHIAEGNGGGDTFVYNRGYGALDIIENDTTASTNTLAFGAGISAGDVAVTMAGIDQFKLSLGNGDVVTFAGSGGGLSNRSYWDANSSLSVPVTNAYTGVEAITFADGTVWTVAQLVEQQVANFGVLYGTEGSDVFDSKGIATEIDGAGGADAIIYKQGYGALTIYDSGQGATLKLGSGLIPANLALSHNGSDVVLSFGGADAITLSGESDGNGVDTIVFGNGIVWDRSDIAAHETHDILGTIWNDTLFGTAGNDTLNGGAGNDTLDGGNGSDTYVFAPGNGQDTVNDVRGSGVTNVVQFGSGIAPGDIYVYTANSGSDIVFGRLDSTDTVTISAMNSDTTKGVDEVHFADGTVWSYADIMARRTSFTTGNDTITGTSGNETLYGAAGDDILQGRAGNDVLDGGTGNDTLYGGDGDDVYRFAPGDGQDLVADFPSGSGTGGVDTIQLGAGILPANVSVAQAHNGADLVLSFAGSNDQITLSNAIGSSLWRIEQVAFADGTNWSYSDLMAKATTPTSGNDIIYGDESNQTLSGGAGDDKLYGARGDDTLIGGTGNDYLNGGPGSDTYVFAQGDGNDTIDDTRNASWINSIQLGADMTQQNTFITTSANGLDIVVGFVDSSDTISIRFMNVSTGNGVDQIKFADGSSWSSADIMARRTAFTAGDDTITGTSGNETLYGGDGNDMLLGLAGNDSLAGGAGNDTLTGGAGNDTLNGGSGSDIAVFAGLQNDYQLTTSGGALSITDLQPTVSGDEGTDQLSGVETAQFSDQSVSLAAPVILDLDGNGVSLVDRTQSTTRFDWNGDGVADNTGWTGQGDAFLALDRNYDGRIDSAAELSFANDKPGAKSDLDGLSAFDSNGDGKLSADDSTFGDFRVWQDANANGVSDAGEVKSLADAGIAAIDLAGSAVNQSWSWDANVTINTGAFERADGSVGQLADAALNYEPSVALSDAGIAADLEQHGHWHLPYGLAKLFDPPRLRMPISALRDPASANGDLDHFRAASAFSEQLASFDPESAAGWTGRNQGEKTDDTWFASHRRPDGGLSQPGASIF
jgi:Ca2+-binding RTX toxin-like protein